MEKPEVIFYRDIKNKKIIDLEIQSFPKKDIAKLLRSIHRLEDYGRLLPRRYAKQLRDKIWELKEDRYRILYFILVKNKYVLRIFMKRTNKTPKSEIETAKKRMRDYRMRHINE